MLIAARTVQGLGAAMLLPQTMAIIIAIFPGHRRGAALGVWGSVAGLATIAGPTVGGTLVTWLGWRWIFFVNIPVGVLALLLGALIIPEVRTGRRQPLDLPGVLIASASLVAISYALVEGQSCHWGTVWSFISIPLILVAGVLLMVIFVLVQALRQDRPPLLPFALFHDRRDRRRNVRGRAIGVPRAALVPRWRVCGGAVGGGQLAVFGPESHGFGGQR